MQVIHNVTVFPISSKPIANGAVAIVDGKVAACGSAAAGLASLGPAVAEALAHNAAELIDGAGGVLTPGFIDAHTHLGIHEEGVGGEGNDYNESSSAVTPDMRAIDGINPADIGIRDALAAGTTAACVLPGSSNVIGGAGVVIRTWGRTIDEMVISEQVGIKVAFGENPKRRGGGGPGTRMGTAALVREWLHKARNYAAKKRRAAEKGDPFDTDLKMEALLPVIEGRLPLRAHAHRADDIVTAIRVARECGVRLVVEHCTEGHLIADYLGENHIQAAVGPSLMARTKIELREKSFETPAALVKAGVEVALITDHPFSLIEHLRVVVALAIRYGMSEEEALKAVTVNAARILGLDDRLGSIEPGKVADLVLWSGNPAKVENVAKKVWIAGRQVV